MLLEDKLELLTASMAEPADSSPVEYPSETAVQPQSQQSVLASNDPSFTTSNLEMAGSEPHVGAGFGLFGGGFTLHVPHDDPAAAGTGLLTGILSGDGFDDTYSWATGIAEEQTAGVPCCHNGDPSTCSKCLVGFRPERTWAIPRGGQCKAEGKAKKHNRARRQLLWGDEEPYPHPPRRNRRFSGSGSMEVSVNESGETGE